MRIMLGVCEYPPYSIGGGAKVYQNLAEEYAKRGHQVLVFYGFYPTNTIFEEIKIFEKGKIKFFQIPLLPTPSFLPELKIRMPINFLVLKNLKELISRENINVAHLHGYGFLSIDIFARILKELKINYLLTIHGWPIKHTLGNPVTKYIFQSYLDNFANKTLLGSSKVSCVSQFLAAKLPAKIQKKSCVIYNSFEPKDLKKTRQNVDIRQKHQIQKEEKIILSLGRIAQIKGFFEVIKLIPRLNKKGVKVRYLIAGEDEGYKKSLVKLINRLGVLDQVEFLGQLDEERKKQYLFQTDFLAIPSLIEGFSLVALEGAAMGKTVLLGQAEAVREVLQGYKKVINLDDPKIAEKMARDQKSLVKFDFSKFESRRIIDKYLKELKSIL